MSEFIIVLSISLFFAFILGYTAGKLGKPIMFWAIMGFFLGPLALPFVFIPQKKK